MTKTTIAALTLAALAGCVADDPPDESSFVGTWEFAFDVGDCVEEGTAVVEFFKQSYVLDGRFVDTLHGTWVGHERSAVDVQINDWDLGPSPRYEVLLRGPSAGPRSPADYVSISFWLEHPCLPEQGCYSGQTSSPAGAYISSGGYDDGCSLEPQAASVVKLSD